MMLGNLVQIAGPTLVYCKASLHFYFVPFVSRPIYKEAVNGPGRLAFMLGQYWNSSFVLSAFTAKNIFKCI